MLSFGDSGGKFGRRNFLRIGAATLGGLTFHDWFSAKARAASLGSSITGKSVILLFLHGGPSQIETFDPKMSAPSDVRSATGEIATAIPGITFGSTFPRLAALADKVSLVRSFVTGDGNHDIKPVVSRFSMNANLGSLFARVAGANHPITGMPRNVALFPQAVDPSTQPAVTAFGQFNATGNLGSGSAPFVPGVGGELQQDLQLTLPMDRLSDRRLLLSQLDRVRMKLENSSEGGLDSLREQAFSTILGGVASAFDISQEDPALVERYDTAPLVRPDQIDRKWNNYNNYVDNAKTLGKLLLMARRLCEAGCGFVTVTTNFVWDMHADVNNATVAEGMGYMGRPLDHALSAYIEDVEARGLADNILLVTVGEMGRTPKINANGGRDHWGNLAPLLLHGGGMPRGVVVGRSNRDAGEPASEPQSLENLVATIARTMFVPAELRLVPEIPEEIKRIVSREPIRGLMDA